MMRVDGWWDLREELSQLRVKVLCTFSTDELRCIQCHVVDGTLDTPMIIRRKCANLRALQVSDRRKVQV